MKLIEDMTKFVFLMIWLLILGCTNSNGTLANPMGESVNNSNGTLANPIGESESDSNGTLANPKGERKNNSNGIIADPMPDRGYNPTLLQDIMSQNHVSNCKQNFNSTAHNMSCSNDTTPSVKFVLESDDDQNVNGTLNITVLHLDSNRANKSKTNFIHSVNFDEFDTSFSSNDRNKINDYFNFTSTNSSETGQNCEIQKCFYHNVTIERSLLPPLLRPTDPQKPILLLKSDRLFEKSENVTVIYEIQNFKLRKKYPGSEIYNTMTDMSLMIFSEEFNSIINVDNVDQSQLSPLQIASLCNYYGSCSVSKTLRTSTCYCDNLCPVYDDCCLNAPKNQLFTFKINIHTSMKSYMTCLENEYVSRRDYAGYWVVSLCPDFDPANVDELDENQYIAIKERCEVALDDAYFIPVASTKTGIHYRNAYCALCHNEKSYLHWKKEIPFQLGIFGKREIKYKMISVQPPLPELQGRICYNFTFIDCPDNVSKFKSGTYFKNLCRSHHNPVFSEFSLDQTHFPNFTKSVLIHRNKYCLLCNTRYFSKTMKCVTNLFMDWIRAYFQPTGWFVQMDEPLHLPKGYLQTCSIGHVWQNNSNTCTKILCPQFKMPYKGTCQDFTSDGDVVHLQFQYKVKGNITDICYKIMYVRLAAMLIKELPETMYLDVPIQKFENIQFLTIQVSLYFRKPFTASYISRLPIFEKWTFMYSGNDKVVLEYIPSISRKLTSDFSSVNTHVMIIAKTADMILLNNSVVCFLQAAKQTDLGPRETCAFSNVYSNYAFNFNATPKVLYWAILHFLSRYFMK